MQVLVVLVHGRRRLLEVSGSECCGLLLWGPRGCDHADLWHYGYNRCRKLMRPCVHVALRDIRCSRTALVLLIVFLCTTLNQEQDVLLVVEQA